MEKSVFHCSPSEWKWTSLKLPSPGTYLKTMQRVDPWYQFKTRSQKCRLFILFQAFFILDWHFEIPAPLARKKSKLSPPVLPEKILILYTSHQFFFRYLSQKTFFFKSFSAFLSFFQITLVLIMHWVGTNKCYCVVQKTSEI